MVGVTTYPIQASFARGEISPRLYARIDLEQYKTALAICRNFIVLRQGGIRRRPGFKFVAKTKFGTGGVRLIAFVFSADQAYALEFGDFYVRFFTLDGRVEVAGLPYEVASPWAGGDVAGLQFATSGDICYVTHAAYPPQKLSRRSETDWTITPVVFEDGPYQDIVKDGSTITPSATGNIVPAMTSNTAPFGTASASSEGPAGPNGYAWNAFDDDANTGWTASGPGAQFLQYTFDVPRVVTGCYIKAIGGAIAPADANGAHIIVSGGDRSPRTFTIEGIDAGGNVTVLLTRAVETGWQNDERRYFSWKNKVAYPTYRLNIKQSNSDHLGLAAYVAVASWYLSGGESDRAQVILTANATTSINKGLGFSNTDSGRLIRLLDEDAVWHWYQIATCINALQVTAFHCSPPLPSLKASIAWRLGAFSSASGYPARVAFWQERVFYARTNDQPQTIWGSQEGDLDNYSVSSPLLDTDAVSLTLRDIGEIQWLADAGDLIVATSSNIRPISAADASKGFSATNFKQGRKIGPGARAIRPVAVSDGNVFVNYFGQSLHIASYSFDASGYVAPDVSVLSEHLFRAGVLELSFAQQPNSIVWGTRVDGALVGLTIEKEQQTLAVHQHALGGNGTLVSQCVIPRKDRSALWAIVDRDNLRTIEIMQPDFEPLESGNAFYLDCGLSYEGAPVSTVYGLDHLEGRSASVVADGIRLPDQTVSGGRISLGALRASKVSVGLSYSSYALTLRPPVGAADGSGLGRKKRMKGVIIDVEEAMGLSVGSVLSNGGPEPIIFRDDMSTVDGTYYLTGTQKVAIDDRWGNEGQLILQTDEPGPCTIRAITPYFDAEP